MWYSLYHSHRQPPVLRPHLACQSIPSGLQNINEFRKCAHVTLHTSGRGPVHPESDRQIACQPLAMSKKVPIFKFTRSSESDYSLPTIKPPGSQAGHSLKRLDIP